MSYLFFRAALLLALAPPLLSGAPPTLVTLDSVDRMVQSRNPELEAARWRIREAAGRARQAGTWSNPTLETTTENNARFREWRAEIGLSQKFPVTDRLRIEKQIGAVELLAAEAEVENVARGLIHEARTILIEILALRQREEVLSKQKALSAELAAFLDNMAARGEGSTLDAGLAKIEAASLKAASLTLAAEQSGWLGRLRILVGAQPVDKIEVGGRLASPDIPDRPVELSRRPDYRAKQWETEAAGRQIRLEQARKTEDIEAGVFAGAERTEDAPAGYDREAIIGFKVSIPLPWWNKNEGAIEEAAARKERLSMETDALARAIHNEAAASRAEMERWARLVGEIEQTLLPLAEIQATEADKALRHGQGEIPMVFRSREKCLQLATLKVDALRQFHLARLRHDTTLGNP